MNSIKLIIEDVSIHVLTSLNEWDKTKIPVVFLHGFMGSANEWKFIFNKLPNPFFAVSIDLIGHGKSESPKQTELYTEDFQLNLLNRILAKLKIDNYVLAGYSMGGRLAISYTLKFPSQVKALILESTTAGIEEMELRKERIKSDNQLAERILKDGIINFVDHWLSLPLFENYSSLTKEDYEVIKKNKLKNNPVGLANSLTGFGTGIMRSKWNDLKFIKCKTLLISGELDRKFSDLNDKMNFQIQNSTLKIIKDCGHNTHLEKPNEFIILTQYFLKNL